MIDYQREAILATHRAAAAEAVLRECRASLSSAMTRIGELERELAELTSTVDSQSDYIESLSASLSASEAENHQMRDILGLALDEDLSNVG